MNNLNWQIHDLTDTFRRITCFQNVMLLYPAVLSVIWYTSCSADSGNDRDDTLLHKPSAPPSEASHVESWSQPPHTPSLQRRSLSPQCGSPLSKTSEYSGKQAPRYSVFLHKCMGWWSNLHWYCACSSSRCLDDMSLRRHLCLLLLARRIITQTL